MFAAGRKAALNEVQKQTRDAPATKATNYWSLATAASWILTLSLVLFQSAPKVAPDPILTENEFKEQPVIEERKVANEFAPNQRIAVTVPQSSPMIFEFIPETNQLTPRQFLGWSQGKELPQEPVESVPSQSPRPATYAELSQQYFGNRSSLNIEGETL